ncbi:S1/P1 nuclease [Adhaeribacter aquaticus]|uniref:S1/P1 nuclease n=1 Tax=Adhaeribacter aquaticus TaxID=299567 RepID=UPI000421586C|nr:S1/P1 nuclease [Adhaeribacter aquaticus]
MKKLITFCLLVPMFIGQAFGWGQTGHRVVGLVAEQHLNKKARKKVLAILQNNSLAEVSTWMDDIKSDAAYDHTHDWHWVTIPADKKYEETQKNPKGDIIMKVEELIAGLKGGALTAQQEQEYIKYLVHLVGDIHQPLHAGTRNDSGGNGVKVEWFGRPTNLHSVWDTYMIDDKNLSFSELADFLDLPSPAQKKQWQSTSIRNWADESRSLDPQVYTLPENNKLSYRYSYQNFGTVQQRLVQAGIRLAGLLNEIYK